MNDRAHGARALLVALIVVLLIGAGAVLLANTTDLDIGLTRRGGSPAATTTPPGPSTTADPVPAPPEPATIVAVTARRSIVVLAPSDGHLLATVDDRFANDRDVADGGIHVHRAPDGTAWYSVQRAGCAGEIWRAAEGGSPVHEGAGTHPAVSPDGSTLAYVDACNGHTLVLRTLASGAERRLGADGAWRQVTAVTAVTWSRDGRALALAARDAEGTSAVHVVNAKASSIGDRTRLGPPAKKAKAGTAWSHPAFRAIDRTVIVVASCCDQGDESVGSVGGNPATSSLIAVDQASGAERGDATFGFEVSRLAADATGAHLLLSDAEGRLHRRLAGDPALLAAAPRVVAFDW